MPPCGEVLDRLAGGARFSMTTLPVRCQSDSPPTGNGVCARADNEVSELVATAARSGHSNSKLR